MAALKCNATEKLIRRINDEEIISNASAPPPVGSITSRCSGKEPALDVYSVLISRAMKDISTVPVTIQLELKSKSMATLTFEKAFFYSCSCLRS